MYKYQTTAIWQMNKQHYKFMRETKAILIKFVGRGLFHFNLIRLSLTFFS